MLSEEYQRRLWKYYSARGWRRSEPQDDVFEPEHPRLLSRSVRLLVEEKVRGRGALLRFFAVASASFAVNELLYALALQRLHWHYFWGQAAILVLVALGTFLLSKFWAFKARH